MARVCAIIAKAQITNGGPVILFQPENEYSGASGIPFPNKKYMQYVIDQARKAGIVVPLIDNDSYPGGTGAPGTGEGAVDIYVSERLTRYNVWKLREKLILPRDLTRTHWALTV